MSFMEHLSDLRLRLRNSAIVFLVVMCVSFVFVKKYFEVLTKPAQDAWRIALPGKEIVFHFISPTEPFWVYTKLAMYAALLFSSPIIFWELWKFIAPGLYKKEKRMGLMVTMSTAGCFIGGALFGFFVICTPALAYMLSFAEQLGGGVRIEPTIMMNEVVGFMLGMLLGCGVAFELPVVLAVLGWIGLVTARSLWKFNKYALVLSAVVGGVLTPSPDVLSQVLMAGPLFGLYNVSILLVWLIERARRKKLEALERETGAELVPHQND
ncbi:MAG: sec-independent protein translocase protein TatC [Myxococcales bacterium]|jgi:sec-independent protein translocase protein TatC|nr:sec-independent protein translocase protein TatC [Myxococcales bacterium]